MAGSIRTITNKDDIEKVLNLFFTKNDVFIRTKSGNLKIQYIGYSNRQVALKIPYMKNLAETVLIFSRSKGNTVYVELQYLEKQGEEEFIFYPVKMQIIYAVRSEDRMNSGNQAGKKLLFIKNIISDFLIENEIALAVKTVDRIKTEVINEIDTMFERKKISFINEGMTDPRIRYFYENPVPYFIKDIYTENDDDKGDFYDKYKREIYSNDYYLINRKNLVSEACVPIMYRKKFPIGYIQVNHVKPLNDAVLKILDEMARNAESIMIRQKVFHPQTDKLLVSDISKSGLSIVFNDRKYIRFFKEKSLINFSLIMPDNLHIDILARVKNITIMDNKVIKVGVQITQMDESTKKVYEHYLSGEEKGND